jgi:hypothetical protein
MDSALDPVDKLRKKLRPYNSDLVGTSALATYHQFVNAYHLQWWAKDREAFECRTKTARADAANAEWKEEWRWKSNNDVGEFAVRSDHAFRLAAADTKLVRVKRPTTTMHQFFDRVDENPSRKHHLKLDLSKEMPPPNPARAAVNAPTISETLAAHAENHICGKRGPQRFLFFCKGELGLEDCPFIPLSTDVGQSFVRILDTTAGPSVDDFTRLAGKAERSLERRRVETPSLWQTAVLAVDEMRDRFWDTVVSIKALHIPTTALTDDPARLQLILERIAQRNKLLGELGTLVIQACHKMATAMKHLGQRMRNWKRNQKAKQRLKQAAAIVPGMLFGQSVEMAEDQLRQLTNHTFDPLSPGQLHAITRAMFTAAVVPIAELPNRVGLDASAWDKSIWNRLLRQLLEFVPCALFRPDDDARNAILLFHTSDPTPGNSHEFLQNFYLATVLGGASGHSEVETRYPAVPLCVSSFTLSTP